MTPTGEKTQYLRYYFNDAPIQMCIRDRYREHISKGEWERLVGRHKDIGFDGTFMTAAEMVASPKVSLILAAERPSRDLNLMLGSIYSQLFPRFEVLVPVEALSLIHI